MDSSIIRGRSSLGISPIAIDVVLFRNAKPRLRIGSPLPDERHPVQESPPHGFRPLKEGLYRLLSEPTRLCISAESATPQRTRPDYHAVAEGLTKTGTFLELSTCLDIVAARRIQCRDTRHALHTGAKGPSFREAFG